MGRYFIQLSYDGTAYCGWQKQPGAPTVQETLDERLSMLAGCRMETIGCGRTDTGVSASEFYAHFDCEREIEDPDDMARRLNIMLPKDIAVQRIFKCGLHSRFDAVRREYRYRIGFRKNPFDMHFWRISGSLDLEAMKIAAEILKEYDDFTSFAKLHGNSKTNICRIYDTRWEETPDGLVFTIAANRFLRGMVRAIVGTLADVGRGKLTTEDFRALIEAKDRSKASMQAPSQGLFLSGVSYGSEI